jgi:hypothetical protein
MCIFNKIKNLISYGLDYSDSNSINADYYNGSENDLTNIFLEILNLSEKPINVFNRESYSNRLKFLAEEGLHIIELKNIDAGSFKYSNDEIEKLIKNSSSKKKTTKKKKK